MPDTHYQPERFEKHWQDAWEKEGIYHAKDFDAREKRYILVEYPYPSGEGLHVGHCLSYIAQDIVSRYLRMKGYNVLYPIGWDAFGLPAENFAIKHKIKPQEATKRNTENYKRQIQSLGISFDWSRELNTTDPAYYKWTQWIFLQLFKAGLAEKKEVPINWCPKDKIGLAFEEVVNGCCERCGTPVERRNIKQWILKITKYADRLIDDLKTVNFLPAIAQQQINWIGRSEGAEIDFPISSPAVTEVVFASNNKGKVERMKRLFKVAGLAVKLRTPEDIGVKDFDVVEDAGTLADNALKKATALAKHTKLPVLADDTGFFVQGAKIDPVMVKRNALDGEDEKKLTIEQIAAKMQAYYQDIADHAGGRVDAEWRNALCLVVHGEKPRIIEALRPVILTNESHGTVDPHLPLRGLYISKATNKYALEQTDDEELQELAPITEGLRQIIAPSLKVFTTRPDTLFGATYMVLSPEHEFIERNKDSIKNFKEVFKYISVAKNKSERERQEHREKTGVELKGIKAINPANKEEIPIWVADYVLSGYGTGAIMAVPAHDERDFEFAKKFDLPIVDVIKGDNELHGMILDGVLINSEQFNGLEIDEARKKITAFVGGEMKVQYKLRDWIFSRQHYWGEPIPIIHCDRCGAVPVPEKNLPVTLPDVEFYEPTDTGESPLAKITDWVNVQCPSCHGPAKRETDTMPTWAGSSWYFLRYTDPHNDKAFADKKKIGYWLPIDLYNGGAEHTTLHLLYSRFWYKFLYDQGYVPTPEPYQVRVQHGMILAPDGQKMSKSRGNVINPDEIVSEYGADIFRLYMMFMGEYDQYKSWNDKNLQGVARFMRRFWDFVSSANIGASSAAARTAVHRAIRDVSADLERRSFNTAVSKLMICLNSLEQEKALSTEDMQALLKIIAPFAPHISEELWHSKLSEQGTMHTASWPVYDPSVINEEGVTLGIQINGKVRADILVTPDMSEADVRTAVLALESVQKYVPNLGSIKKFIYIEKKIISIVV